MVARGLEMATYSANVRQNRLNSVKSLKTTNSRAPSFSRQGSDEADPVEQDVPFRMRQPSLYHWFKNKLWCIRRSASIESRPECYRPKTSNNVVKRPKEKVQKVKRRSKSAIKVPNERRSTSSLSKSTNTSTAKKLPLTDPQPPRGTDPEKQVTFNDIVKTHIKVKYVTADEMRQLKSMNPHHIMYQLIALKNEELSANRATPSKNNKTRKKHVNRKQISTIV